MATDQKMENLLNLALDATPEEREKSLELDVGYDAREREWELIAKYSGSLDRLRAQGVRAVELAGGYAILTAPQGLVSYIAAQPEIEYLEKPKRLFFSVAQGKTASCIHTLQTADRALEQIIPGKTPEGGKALLGQGILVAVIDSGVDYTHPEFRYPDGSSRILAIWDQSTAGSPPAGYALGTEYIKAQIDEALRTGARLPVRDLSGHGTQVLGVAAGNGGVTPQAYLLVVKLGNPKPDSFPKTTELMQALDYVYRKAEEWGLPVAVNLSFGNAYGPHNGTGLLERFIENASGRWRSVIVAGTGNEGAGAGHTSGTLARDGGAYAGAAAWDTLSGNPAGTAMWDASSGSLAGVAAWDASFGNPSGVAAWDASFGNPAGTVVWNAPFGNPAGAAAWDASSGNLADTAPGTQEIQLGISRYESTVNVQLWKSYADEFAITLFHPNGQTVGPLPENLGAQRYRMGNTELLIYYGEPNPYSISQEIYFDLLPVGDYIDSGIWRFRLTPRSIADGRYDMWLPQAEALNQNTRFYRPVAENTLTVPSTARGVIAVGAYDARSLTYAPFSGRGAEISLPVQTGLTTVKPDLAAPGTEIRTADAGGGYASVSGTSFAAPFVTGAAAMLMQWGIVNGNDPYLYGEKVRAYLIRGARPLPGFSVYPNNQVGYGALCVRESLPG